MPLTRLQLFPNDSKKEDDVNERTSAAEVDIDSKNTTAHNPREEKDAEVVKKDADNNAPDLVPGKEGNLNGDLWQKSRT